VKLYLLSGTILFLIVGISLAGNSLEAMGESEEGLKKYENATLGISFQYPSNWTQQDGSTCPVKGCLNFIITVPKLQTTTNTSLNPIVCGVGDKTINSLELFLSTIEKCDAYRMIVGVYGLDDPTSAEKPCYCKTLKDFVAWNYDRSGDDKDTFINDNQTLIGSNYSAWQMKSEDSTSSVKEKKFTVWAINDNLGYRFIYRGPSESRFDRHLDVFRDMLKTVKFTTPTPEKKPSFLNSSETANSSLLSSAPTASQDTSVNIMSSNDFIDSIGFLHVVGEIQNNTPTGITFVKVTGTFYDSSNQVVATTFTYTNPSDIGPGNKAPFELLLTSASIPVSQIDHYNLQASYD